MSGKRSDYSAAGILPGLFSAQELHPKTQGPNILMLGAWSDVTNNVPG